MPRSFDDLLAEVQGSWSDDAQRLHRAASEVFAAEVSTQVELGRQLAAARGELNLTQGVLAEVSGVPQSEISRIENGLANPTVETVSRLAAATHRKLALI